MKSRPGCLLEQEPCPSLLSTDWFSFELRYVAADLCIHPLSCVMWLLIYMYSRFELRYVAKELHVYLLLTTSCKDNCVQNIG